MTDRGPVEMDLNMSGNLGRLLGIIINHNSVTFILCKKQN